MGPAADKEHVWFLDTVHPALQEALTHAGHICHDATTLSREALLRHAASADAKPIHGVVLRSRIRLDEQMLRALPDLRWIARSGSGLENIDLEVASDLGVAVHSSPEGNRDAVGEHTLGMLLAVLHKLRLGDQSIRARRWEREAHRGRELKSLTVGIMGYGHMGSAFAERLAGMGCRVLAYDKHKEGWGESPCRRPAPARRARRLDDVLPRRGRRQPAPAMDRRNARPCGRRMAVSIRQAHRPDQHRQRPHCPAPERCSMPSMMAGSPMRAWTCSSTKAAPSSRSKAWPTLRWPKRSSRLLEASSRVAHSARRRLDGREPCETQHRLGRQDFGRQRALSPAILCRTKKPRGDAQGFFWNVAGISSRRCPCVPGLTPSTTP